MTTVVEFPDRRIVAEEAAEWLIRLDADTPPSREELQALGEWLHRSPAHREELESLAALWGRMNVLTELAVPLGSSGRPVTRSRPESGMSSRALSWRVTALLVVSIAAVVALGWVLFVPGAARDPLRATNALYATAVGQQKTAALADGSQVILNTNSQIKVDYGEGYRRVHLLQGEALFKVAKDASRPFRVYAGNRRIEAVGTAFSVYLNGADVSVTVSEGRVSLASVDPSPSKAVVASLGALDAGQAATIRGSAESAAGSAGALETIEPLTPELLVQRLAWREGILMFSGERLEDVVKEISRYTTVSIEIPDASVRDMRIGGRFPVGETEVMLAALETNFHLRVTRLGHNRVILSAAQ